MSQIAFPLVTPATATNPLSYIVEPADAFGTKITASPSYTAVAVTENVDFAINNTLLDIFQAGSFYKYSQQTGGQNYTLDIAVQPQDINFLKIGTNTPVPGSAGTTAGLSASSYQFVMKHKKSFGTAQVHDVYTFFLGCRPATTTISVSPQQKVSATMNWVIREIQETNATNGGLTSPTIPTLGSITGPVIVDSDAGALPLTINSNAYATDGFSMTVDTGLISKAYNGSGRIDASYPGTFKITGNIKVPAGSQGNALKTLSLSSQTGVTASYLFKTGVMKANFTGFVLGNNTGNFPGNADSFLEDTLTWEASGVTLATS
jgi:hypothetical protein